MSDDILTQLRQLKIDLDAGAIDDATYLERFRAIDASVGFPCADCGQRIASVWHGRRQLCATCALGTVYMVEL
jgi:hypothetical protein